MSSSETTDAATKRSKAKTKVEASPSKDDERMLTKCAGGKAWVVSRFPHLLPKPEDVRIMHEPFVGGGAVMKHYLGRVPVRVNDKNAKLMAVYAAVRDEPESLIKILQLMRYDKDEFYRTRTAFNERWFQEEIAMRAAWFIYLNRTCFNGLYRENKLGHFNVPFGDYKNPLICDADGIRAWSEKLRKSNRMLYSIVGTAFGQLGVGDFQPTFDLVGYGDFVFLDCPYVPVNDTTAKFTEYQAGGFSMADQERLAACLPLLDRKGVRFLFTNAGIARELYKGWNILEVAVPRAINSKAGKRGKVPEIFVSNYPLTDPTKA
jgi:DNA adenine methylase